MRRELASHPSATTCSWILKVSSLCCILGFSISHQYCIADAKPSPAEVNVFNKVQAVLEESQRILAEVSQYKGASKEIREVNGFTAR